MKSLKYDFFQSPTYGKVSLVKMGEIVENYFSSQPAASYQIIIGSDSAGRPREGVDFVTAVLIHRVGRGGIYFWQRNNLKDKKFLILRNRIWQEAIFSIEAAEKVLNLCKRFARLAPESLEIHIDVGRNGPTKEMIAELTGFVRANGFQPKVKPEAYCATKVADRHV